MQFVSYTLLCFASLFSIVDPFAALPTFLALVGRYSSEYQRRIALQASLTCMVTLLLFAAAGSLIFRFFGITAFAFKIAGGVLLFGLALEMMRAHSSETKGTEDEKQDAQTRQELGFIPLGLPLLSGPGSIATVMVLFAQSEGTEKKIGVLLAIVGVSLSALLVLRSAGRVSHIFGKTGLLVTSRIMGLMLSAVSIQFIVDGVKQAFPLFSSGS